MVRNGRKKVLNVLFFFKYGIIYLLQPIRRGWDTIAPLPGCHHKWKIYAFHIDNDFLCVWLRPKENEKTMGYVFCIGILICVFPSICQKILFEKLTARKKQATHAISSRCSFWSQMTLSVVQEADMIFWFTLHLYNTRSDKQKKNHSIVQGMP